MKKKQKVSQPMPRSGIGLNGTDTVYTDPMGSYTGVPADPTEKPVQDADDL